MHNMITITLNDTAPHQGATCPLYARITRVLGKTINSRTNSTEARFDPSQEVINPDLQRISEVQKVLARHGQRASIIPPKVINYSD